VKDSVAQVAILQCGAIRVGLARTRQLLPNAGTEQALIVSSARIAVIAGSAVVRALALPFSIAHVIGAFISIVAIKRHTHAQPLLALVARRAQVAVNALHAVKRDMLTAGVASARIIGAKIIVIAQPEVVAVHQFAFVHVAVTIVIEAVALLGLGLTLGFAVIAATAFSLLEVGRKNLVGFDLQIGIADFRCNVGKGGRFRGGVGEDRDFNRLHFRVYVLHRTADVLGNHLRLSAAARSGQTNQADEACRSASHGRSPV